MIRKSIALALLGAIGAFTGIDKAAIAMNRMVQQAPSKRQVARSLGYVSAWNYPAKDGHSVAHGKRIAAKARNVKRNRAAHKGK